MTDSAGMSPLIRLLASGQLTRDPAPGVLYRHFDANGTLLYIGSTELCQLRGRHIHHANTSRWWRYVARVQHERVHPNRRAAFHAEREAIRAERPIFNRTGQGRDEREAREAAYVRANADEPPRWVRRCTHGCSPAARRAETDAMLIALGVITEEEAGPPAPAVMRFPILDLGEYLAQEYIEQA